MYLNAAEKGNKMRNYVMCKPQCPCPCSRSSPGVKGLRDENQSLPFRLPGYIAQSVARLTQDLEAPGSIPVWPHTFVSLSADLRRAVFSYRQKYVHKVLVNHLGSLSLPRKSVVRLTDHLDMTKAVYRGRKTKK